MGCSILLFVNKDGKRDKKIIWEGSWTRIYCFSTDNYNYTDKSGWPHSEVIEFLNVLGMLPHDFLYVIGWKMSIHSPFRLQ